MSWYPEYEKMRVLFYRSDLGVLASYDDYLLWEKAQHAWLSERMLRFNRPMLNRYTFFNPSRSQSSPWAKSDMWGRWHPLDAMLAERRAILAGERAALDAAEKKDAAWWREVGRG